MQPLEASAKDSDLEAPEAPLKPPKGVAVGEAFSEGIFDASKTLVPPWPRASLLGVLGPHHLMRRLFIR